MRSAIFMGLTSIGLALEPSPLNDVGLKMIGIMALIFFLMDIIEFSKKNS